MLIFEKINKLIINLKTTDYFEIDGKYIENIYFDEIHRTIDRITLNAYGISECAKNIILEIDNNAKDIKSSFGDTLFDRLLNQNDIVSFEIFFPIEGQENKLHKEHIFTPWDYEKTHHNNYQNAFLNPEDLYIHIQEKS